MQRTCKQCSAEFGITDEDLAFYEKVSPVFGGKTYMFPPPTLCPDCRAARRYPIRNERKLYHRTCDATGKDIISIYSPDKPYTVYDTEAWWSDNWDPLSYGKEIDFSKPFFGQLQDLLLAVPHLAMINVQNENSPHVNQCGWSKNCYMAFMTDFSQECYYTESCFYSKNCVDCMGMHESELCYGCIDCSKCYHTFFSQDCSNSSDCSFCYDCKGCRNCLGCVGLRNAEYYINNERLTPEEWQKQAKKWTTYTPALIEEHRKKALALKLRMPHPHAVMTNCTDCTGNYLSDSKNARVCFDGVKAEDCRYCTLIPTTSRDCYDMTGGAGELLYETISVGPGYHSSFVWHCWNEIADLLYCIFCMNGSKNLFGCVGLKKKQYCILNRQYTKEEYEILVPKLIEHMRKTGEWGEFFPSFMTPFAYNETVAQEYVPLTQKEAEKRGYQWREEIDEIPKVEKIIPADRLPVDIGDIPNDILHWAIECRKTGRPYRIIRQELAFYREQGLSIPRLHPDERYRWRLSQRNPRRLWTRNCAKCDKEIETTYAPGRPEIIYCEECYLKEVY
ncbi:hypothetical protein HZA45_03635 [Candidatus Peregrinibacteria bacterium]|nr:hypothetical protein [Candidatus Peregrinibacteria bacterium]